MGFAVEIFADVALKILAILMRSAIDGDASIIVFLSSTDLFVLAMFTIPTLNIDANIVFTNLFVIAVIVTCTIDRFARVSNASFHISAMIICSARLFVALVSEAKTVAF